MTINTGEELIRPSITIERNWPVNLDSADISDFENGKQYKTAAVYLRSLNNAWISPDSVIYKNGIVVPETLISADVKQYYRFRHLAKKIVTAKKIRLNKNKNYLLVTNNDSAGHFHWFCEVLPKLVSIKDRLKDFVLLLPDRPYIRKIAINSLQLMNFLFEDIVFLDASSFYKAPNIFYLSNPSRGGFNDELMQCVQQKLLQGKKSGERKIYVSRQKAAFRKIVNEKELTDMLAANGFEILMNEDLSLTEQVDIFSSCKTLVGIHGAGLTNCIFMHPGSNVLELRKKENAGSNIGYWLLADSLQHHYYYYNGIPDSDKPLVGRGCNLEIPLKGLNEKVRPLFF